MTLCSFICSMLAGSYVALTVLGRPPGLTQIPLSEAESEMLGVSISSPNSPATERPYSPQDRFSAHPSWVLNSFFFIWVPYIYDLVHRCFSFLFDYVLLIFYCACVYISKFDLCLENGFLFPIVFLLFLSLCSQDENNSACNQKADGSVKMLSREQQELQVSRTITVTGTFILCDLIMVILVLVSQTATWIR